MNAKLVTCTKHTLKKKKSFQKNIKMMCSSSSPSVQPFASLATPTAVTLNQPEISSAGQVASPKSV